MPSVILPLCKKSDRVKVKVVAGWMSLEALISVLYLTRSRVCPHSSVPGTLCLQSHQLWAEATLITTSWLLYARCHIRNPVTIMNPPRESQVIPILPAVCWQSSLQKLSVSLWGERSWCCSFFYFRLTWKLSSEESPGLPEKKFLLSPFFWLLWH